MFYTFHKVNKIMLGEIIAHNTKTIGDNTVLTFYTIHLPFSDMRTQHLSYLPVTTQYRTYILVAYYSTTLTSANGFLQ